MHNLTEGRQDVITANHLVVDGQICLAVVIAGREDVRFHIETGRREIVVTLSTQIQHVTSSLFKRRLGNNL